MAVFTDLSDDDRDSIAVAYGITPLTSVIGIADGDTETTYLFRSQRGEYIVTLFENGAEPFDLERAFRTMEVLSAAGVPCPRTVRDENGEATIRVAGKLVAVVGFVQGSPSACASPAKCFDLGRRIAQIHRTLMPASPGNGQGLRRGPIHGALFPDNVFFLGDSVSGIINFRLRHDDVLIAELANVLVRWTMLQDGALDMNRAETILKGYCGVRPLQDNERQSLAAFVLAAAATFLAVSDGGSDLPVRVGNAFVSAQGLLRLRETQIDAA
ncbi:phosphotransferase [Mesorhizobium sp. MSK_1335]|uniref:Phosphotransferase n=1 Tax=Mesorhizobium montanum TaxID=3072323 RepID=A0ABU4ZR96_9HYPH|nr:phosphotransferase [Mesorhizobium sp. MSK_1335]MDX8527926.1 phosphotransferase [Mesorhizobium sp. MSK_1335]